MSRRELIIRGIITAAGIAMMIAGILMLIRL